MTKETDNKKTVATSDNKDTQQQNQPEEDERQGWMVIVKQILI